MVSFIHLPFFSLYLKKENNPQKQKKMLEKKFNFLGTNQRENDGISKKFSREVEESLPDEESNFGEWNNGAKNKNFVGFTKVLF